MKNDLLVQITETLSTSHRLDTLVRRLLEMLELVTELESTYLTEIDLDANIQRVLFARNVRTLTIPEGLAVPWGDTLCKRALDEGRPYTDNVAECWGDSEAARALGLRTYLSTPVRLSDGSLFGTLCAASSETKPLTEKGQAALLLFAELISQYIEREQLLERLEQANALLQNYSYTDTLTGLSNRRALREGLEERIRQAREKDRQVVVAFMDLDDFKGINDRHGHDTGDDFLRAVAGRLAGACRADELLGRLGGDEFVLIGQLDRDRAGQALPALRKRLQEAVAGRYELNGVTLDYAGASLGLIALDPEGLDAERALDLADQAMYDDKHQRKALQD